MDGRAAARRRRALPVVRFVNADELDLLRYASGHPEPFRAHMIEQVDEHTLAEMLHGCSVILLCEPVAGEPSEGVHVERPEAGQHLQWARARARGLAGFQSRLLRQAPSSTYGSGHGDTRDQRRD